MSSDRFNRFFENASTLPSMPEVAHQLLLSFENDNIDLQSLADLIGQDQGLTAKLLRLANSARYNPGRPIGNIKDAAATLGLTSLRDLSLAACVAGAFPLVPGFDRLRFWRQCLATAGHARMMASVCDIDADTAYLGGLMMRTGQLLMLMTEPDTMARIDGLATDGDSRLQHEEALLECTHLEVSAELARRWNFPPDLVVALWAADNPLQAQPFSRLAGVLRLAAVMGDAGDRGLPEIGTLLDTQPELVAAMHIDLGWLGIHMMPWDMLTNGADLLLH